MMKKKIKKYTFGGNITEQNKAVMTPSSIMEVVGNSLDVLGQFIPEDNDNYGISSKGQSISSGIQTGLNAAGDIASSIPGVGTIVGGALKAGAFLTKGFTAIADAVKEKKNPRDKRWDMIYNPQNAGTGISFGNNTNELIEMALGGFVKKYEDGGEFKQYKAPTHEEGGQFIDKNKNPTNNSNEAVAEVEKKENSYKDYIFSDTLLYKNNITFAQQAKKINNKYKDRQDIISKNSLDLELTELMKKNEQLKENQKSLELSEIIPKAKNGFLLKPLNINFNNLLQKNKILNTENFPIENKRYISPVEKNKNIKKFDIEEPTFDYNFNDLYSLNHEYYKYAGASDGASGSSDGEVDSSDNKETDKTITKNKPSPYEIAGYGIKGAELLGHAIQAFKKPELVNPVYNPEENAIKNLMSKRIIDNQDLLNELELQNTATKQNIADNSSSVGTMISNLQKLHANDVSNIAKITSQTQQANNTYRGEEANVLNSLGQQKASAQVYAEELNTRAKANVQNQRDKFLKESIGGLGDFLLKKDYINKENNFQMNILKSKGINFEPSDYENWNKVGVDIVKFTGELESESDTEKRKIKMEELKKKYLEKGGTEEAWESNLIVKGLTNKYLK